MSAINPASFASPSLGLQAPSGIGPGAVVAGGARSSQAERRPQPEQPAYSATQAGRGYSGAFTQAFSPVLDRGAMPTNTFQPPGYTYGYSPFTAPPRNAGVSPGGYAPVLDTNYGGGFSTPTDYSSMNGRFPSSHASTPNHDSGEYRQLSGHGTPSDNWIGNFQSLSMNTR